MLWDTFTSRMKMQGRCAYKRGQGADQRTPRKPAVAAEASAALVTSTAASQRGRRWGWTVVRNVPRRRWPEEGKNASWVARNANAEPTTMERK